MYWILDLDNEVHSIRVIWYSGLQESKNQARDMGQGQANQGQAFSMLPMSTALMHTIFMGGI